MIDSVSIIDKVVSEFVKNLEILKIKYSDTLENIEKEIVSTDIGLSSLFSDLDGNETDMLAINMLKNILK